MVLTTAFVFLCWTQIITTQMSVATDVTTNHTAAEFLASMMIPTLNGVLENKGEYLLSMKDDADPETELLPSTLDEESHGATTDFVNPTSLTTTTQNPNPEADVTNLTVLEAPVDVKLRNMAEYTTTERTTPNLTESEDGQAELIPTVSTAVNKTCKNCSKHAKILKPEDSNVIYNTPSQMYQSIRNFLTNRHVMVLVDDTEENRLDASHFVRSVLKIRRYGENFWLHLMMFNSTGVTEIVESIREDSKELVTLSKKHQEVSSSTLGQSKSNKTLPYFALLNAGQLLPQNSGILLFINRYVMDEDLQQLATDTLKKKSIRLVVIWGCENHQEGKLLKELSVYTGGKFIVNTFKNWTIHSYNKFLEDGQNNTTHISVISSKQNILGETTLSFPIDSDVTGIHISISPFVTKGTIITPNGYAMDIFNSEEIAKYSMGSFAIRTSKLHEIHMKTTAQAQYVGVWRLRLNNAGAVYNITVYGYGTLTTEATIVSGTNKTGEIIKKLKLDVTGGIASINNITLLAENGKTLIDNLKYSVGDWEKYETENIDGTKNNETREIDFEITKIPQKPFYAHIKGTDAQGNEFSRLTHVRWSNGILNQPCLSVDLGLGSEIITSPSRRSELRFEVTNYGNTATYVKFVCKDEKSILLAMDPWWRIINAQDTITVRVTLNPRPGSYQDLITFQAVGSTVVEKKVLVDVGLNAIPDNEEPDIDYDYTSDCTDKLLRKCESGTWSMEIRAKDRISGLLHLTTFPRGLVFPNGYTSGTKEEVTGYLTGSCCDADIQIIAVDKFNNRAIRYANAYRAPLSTGTIIAIVFGVLILVVLILLIIYLIKKYCKDSDSYVLPVYGGRRY